MKPPEEFPFPFPPYSIQKDFMKNLYMCLENGGLGIFESPTGTGKSLSIICGAFRWLLDYTKEYNDTLTSQLQNFDDQIKEIDEKFQKDWFSNQTAKIKINSERLVVYDKLQVLKNHEERLNKFKEKISRENMSKGKGHWKSTRVTKKQSDKNDNQDQVKVVKSSEDKPDNNDINLDLILDDFHSDSDSDNEDKPEDSQLIQLFFCSRTHSQLTQFIGEVKRSPYAEEISLVPLSSRLNYCVNKTVKKLNHVNLINDRCLQMQKKKVVSKEEKEVKRTKVATSCPFYPGNQSLLIADIVTSIQDVEEIADNGKKLNTCAYYASRRSLPHVKVVLVPYNIILHKNTRVSSGINLTNSILIIDEAHNLLEAIESMHSATITGRNILHCFNQLSQYQKRFESVLSAKNVLKLNQLSFCLKKFIKILGGTTKSQLDDKTEKQESTIYTIEKFEISAEIDTINIFQLIQFVTSSKLIHKLRGYVEQYSGDLKVRPVALKPTGVCSFLNSLKKDVEPTQETACENLPEIFDNPLMLIINFLECLTVNCADGRIFILPGPTIGQGAIKFLLMNPAAHFHDIIKEARSIILTGGTMEPITEFKNQLFIGAGADPERIVTFSCDHVIPKENILTRIVTQGPTGKVFEFNYKNRDCKELLNELGRTLINLCNVIPSGIVTFFPSYNYEASAYKYFETSGVIKKIQEKKKIFREPKTVSDVNLVLQNYADAIKNPQLPQNGAILFSVVGGKLSEGLNFSDDLGRCVIVVGMPYPNTKSPELQEKKKYLNENVRTGAGNEYYENTCMKAVNQCIGRAVRHINDYSTVILLDKRYSNKSKALPGWIQKSLAVNNNFSSTIGDVSKFFASKKTKNVIN